MTGFLSRGFLSGGLPRQESLSLVIRLASQILC